MIPMIGIALELAKLFAPTLIGKIAGDKAGKVAQDVVDIATKATGAPTPEQALEMLKADAAKQHEYRLALLDYEVKMATLASEERRDERRTDAENIAGARIRDVDMRKLTGGENRRADAMVLMAVWGLVFDLLIMGGLAYLKATYPESISEGVFTALLTQLANVGAIFGLCLRDAFTFEFGSSRGSRVKDEAAALATALSQRKE